MGAERQGTRARGGSPRAAFQRLDLEQLRDRLVGAGLLVDREVADALALLDAPGFVCVNPISMAAWGRRPAA